VRGARATFEFHRAMWIYYRKWGAHRRNPLVLVPLLSVVSALGAIELVRNALRLRRDSRKTSGEPLPRQELELPRSTCEERLAGHDDEPGNPRTTRVSRGSA
jgi:hypothetical protein